MNRKGNAYGIEPQITPQSGLLTSQDIITRKQFSIFIPCCIVKKSPLFNWSLNGIGFTGASYPLTALYAPIVPFVDLPKSVSCDGIM